MFCAGTSLAKTYIIDGYEPGQSSISGKAAEQFHSVIKEMKQQEVSETGKSGFWRIGIQGGADKTGSFKENETVSLNRKNNAEAFLGKAIPTAQIRAWSTGTEIDKKCVVIETTWVQAAAAPLSAPTNFHVVKKTSWLDHPLSIFAIAILILFLVYLVVAMIHRARKKESTKKAGTTIIELPKADKDKNDEDWIPCFYKGNIAVLIWSQVVDGVEYWYFPLKTRDKKEFSRRKTRHGAISEVKGRMAKGKWDDEIDQGLSDGVYFRK
jgi:cbb3-type cytochrome oxidase subunit 3